jgi:bacteriocin-like protein
MIKEEIIELNDKEMSEISGGTGSLINININPTINISFSNKMNIGILVIAGSTILKPITFTQKIY